MFMDLLHETGKDMWFLVKVLQIPSMCCSYGNKVPYADALLKIYFDSVSVLFLSLAHFYLIEPDRIFISY